MEDRLDPTDPVAPLVELVLALEFEPCEPNVELKPAPACGLPGVPEPLPDPPLPF